MQLEPNHKLKMQTKHLRLEDHSRLRVLGISFERVKQYNTSCEQLKAFWWNPVYSSMSTLSQVHNYLAAEIRAVVCGDCAHGPTQLIIQNFNHKKLL